MGPTQIWLESLEEGEKHRGKIPCEDKGRGQGDTSTNQGMPKITTKPSEARQKCGADFQSQPSGETNSANTSSWTIASRIVRQWVSVV